MPKWVVLILSLSEKNALAINVDALASGISGSVCLGAGQFCTNPGLIVTLPNEELLSKIADHLDAVSRGVMLNSGIAAAYRTGLERLKSNNRVIWLNVAEIKEGDMTPPNAIFKTTVTDFLADKSLGEEVFGPLTLVVEAQNEAGNAAAC